MNKNNLFRLGQPEKTSGQTKRHTLFIIIFIFIIITSMMSFHGYVHRTSIKVQIF
jgi:hypothetical protein